MTMSVVKKMLNDGAEVYYSPEWHRTLETHMGYLKQLTSNTTAALVPGDVYKYEADLFGLLTHLKIEPRYHWVTMRVNDMTAPSQLRMDRFSLVIPDFAEIERLRQVFQTTKKKVT